MWTKALVGKAVVGKMVIRGQEGNWIGGAGFNENTVKCAGLASWAGLSPGAAGPSQWC